jgi:hypothetical protein
MRIAGRKGERDERSGSEAAIDGRVTAAEGAGVGKGRVL